MTDITHLEKPYTKQEVEHILNPVVKKWFYSRFPSFSIPQTFGVVPIHSRENILISAPTGATKTLTSFLAILNELVDSALNNCLEDKVYAIYISPLKALNYDIEVNLVTPLKEIEAIAGRPLGIRVAVRTGDTTTSERTKMLKNTPHILITTPESLSILLCSMKFREKLTQVDWCIIDEIHALAENKRGVHLSLSMERLQRLATHMCRVGLSATVAPLDEIAKFLVGTNRPCKIVDVQFIKNVDLKVLSPVPNLIDSPHAVLHKEMYTLLDNLIQDHKTTIVFTNTRAATERVVDHLKHRFPAKYSTNIGAHHGSLGKESRRKIEESLRKGELKVCVSSTSLELGIDIGYVDLVVCLGSPKSVARLLQRAGRAGHMLHSTVKARIIVMDRDDLVECTVLVKSALEKKIDRIHLPSNCLDVLAQHVFGMALEDVWEEKEMYKTIKQSYCYKDLSLTDFNEILEYLAGEFSDLEDRYVYAKIWRKDGKVGKRGKMARVIYMTNIGTIPDESFIVVKVGTETVGMLDESFLERLKPGDTFVLGGNTYQFKYSRGMTAQVTASVNRPPTVPSWNSESLPLSLDLANEIGRFRRLVFEKITKPKKEVIDFIHTYCYVDENAANAVYLYMKEQYDYCKYIPNDKLILVERISDKMVFHSMFGRRVNDCLSRAIAFAIGRNEHKDVEIGINDNGFFVSGKARAVDELKILKSEKLDLVMNAAIEKSEVMNRRFRHVAMRSLMILRNYLGRIKNVGKQQMAARLLLPALKRINPNFGVLREAKRECLEDLMDIKGTKLILKGIEDGTIKVVEITTALPSPFAFNIALQGHLDVLKIEERHEFLMRMHEMILAKIGLKPEIKDFDYYETWKNTKKATEDEREQRLLKLKSMLWDIEKLPRFAKFELARLIDGDENISKRVLDEVIAHKHDIQKDWPEELAEFIINKVERILE